MIVRSDSISALLDELSKTHFYGQVSLQFRDGEITLVERKETIVVSGTKSQGGPRDSRNDSR